jgi:hypothetical protein
MIFLQWLGMIVVASQVILIVLSMFVDPFSQHVDGGDQ